MRWLNYKERPFKFVIGRSYVCIWEPLPAKAKKRFRRHNIPVADIRKLAGECAPHLTSPIRPVHIHLWIMKRIERMSDNIIVDDRNDARIKQSIDDWVLPPF